jgi:DNA-binding CsgD family transcriptional regulator
MQPVEETPHCAQGSPQDHEDPIYRLWDELSDLGPAAIDKALRYCLRTISDLIGAQNAFWIGAVRVLGERGSAGDPMFGWRIKAIETLNAEYTSPQRIRSSYELPKQDPGDTTRAIIAGAGSFRVRSLGTGLVDLAAFQKTEPYDRYYRQTGITDRIWGVFPINKDSESYFVFDTFDEGRWFNADELTVVGRALRGIKWFHRQLFLTRGLGLCDEALSPTERRLVPELLRGDCEKVIAERLALTAGTLHQYATHVYRKFGVRGRAEFLALWHRSW